MKILEHFFRAFFLETLPPESIVELWSLVHSGVHETGTRLEIWRSKSIYGLKREQNIMKWQM